MSEDGVTKSSHPLVALSAGCIAGGIECIAVWPMEYIKTQLQLQTSSSKPPYNGVFEGIRYTYQKTGFFSLYRGLGITLLGSVPKAGIRFGGNAYFKQIFADEKGKLSMSRQFLAGMGAGMVEAVLAVTPMETVKTKLIESNQSLIPGVAVIWREKGIAGFYQGVFATILKQSSNQGLRFMFFNKYKDFVTEEGRTQMHPLTALLGGMLAGCFSTLGNNPFDVVKTKMQGKNAHYKNTWDCFMQIVRTSGVSGLYKGLFARLGRVVPGQGIIFMSFESIQTFIEGAFINK